MRTLLAGLSMMAATVAPLAAQRSPAPSQSPAPNTLTREEASQGFRLLFDGATTTGWRTFKGRGPPAGWAVMDGALTRVGDGGDIITEEEFGDFELRLDWRVAPGGNSGILFRVTEDVDAVYESGPEYQLLDDERHPDGASRLTAAGSDFALHPAPAGVVKPAGQWNQARLIVRGAHVEHWLNGVKVVDYELWTDEWERLVRESKFAAWPPYGRATTGHIALQDHGDEVSFRSIRIRVLR